MKDSIYGSVPVENRPKAKFDLSHDVKLTGNMGYLIPVLMEECVPGDNWRWSGKLLARFAPMLAPVMHLIHATFHCFHVPNRILTTVWKDFITGGEDGEFAGTTPYLLLDQYLDLINVDESSWNFGVGVGSLWDYMGCPTFDWTTYGAGPFDNQTQINVLPWLAYQCIWQNYYKDQNVDTTDTMKVAIAGGAVSTATFSSQYNILRKRAWSKDAFTSALPWPQRGDDVLIPIEGEVDYTYLSSSLVKTAAGANATVNWTLGVSPTVAGQMDVNAAGADTPGRVENIEGIDFTNTTITINDFRTAVVVQQWLELNARGGSRYNESILQQFNERVPDYRLDFPEYIGGGKQLVQISEVLTTANSEDSGANVVPPGTMAGHGISYGGSNSFSYQVKEHGWMVVILSVLPETSYQQGLPKKFTRFDRLDYLWPVMAGLGEQEILTQEVFYAPNSANAFNKSVFGYQQRYWEYKSIPNRTCGEFRTTQDYWTMTRIFPDQADVEVVNTDFVYSDPTTRIFAVEDASHKLWMQVVHDLSVIRPLPYYSVPGLLKI